MNISIRVWYTRACVAGQPISPLLSYFPDVIGPVRNDGDMQKTWPVDFYIWFKYPLPSLNFHSALQCTPIPSVPIQENCIQRWVDRSWESTARVTWLQYWLFIYCKTLDWPCDCVCMSPTSPPPHPPKNDGQCAPKDVCWRQGTFTFPFYPDKTD